MRREKPTRWPALLLLALALLLPAAPLRAAEEKPYRLPGVEIKAAVLPDRTLQVAESRTWSFTGSFTWVEQWVKHPPGFRLAEIGRGGAGPGLSGERLGPAWHLSGHPGGGAHTHQVVLPGEQRHPRLRPALHRTRRRRPAPGRGRAVLAVDRRPVEGRHRPGRRRPAPARRRRAERVRAWGHGPLQGVVAIPAAGQVTWTVGGLPARTFLQGRVVFPTALVPRATRQTGKTALPGILQEEQGRADRANRQRPLSPGAAGRVLAG